MFAFIDGHSLTPIDICAFITIGNKLSDPLKVDRMWWKDGKWQLCPISILHGQIYGLLSDNTNVASFAVPLDIADSLERKLTAVAIAPRESVSGWTLWECPTGWCFPGRTFGLEDDLGDSYTTIPDFQQNQTHSLSTTPPGIMTSKGGKIPLARSGPGSLNSFPRFISGFRVG
jgi:hypothetical protein